MLYVCQCAIKVVVRWAGNGSNWRGWLRWFLVAWGGSFLLWAWIWGFSPAQPPSSITSCEGAGLPAHTSGNHTAEAVSSPTWTKRQGRTDETTSESRGGVSGVTDARGLKDV